MSIQSELAAFGMTQVLVVMKASAAAGSSAGLAGQFTSSEASRGGALAMADAITNQARGQRKKVKGKTSKLKAPAKSPAFQIYPNLGVMLGNVDPVGYAGLQASDQVESVLPAPEISLIRPVARRESTKLSAGPTWGLKKLRVPEVWAAGFTGKGVIVGHLDTGIDAKHPALKTSLHAFAEFDRLGRIVPDAKPWDSDDHGTHTAGTIAGRKVPEGEFGVAPGCKLASAMVIEGGNIVARILGGMDWVIGQNAKILSMSLGLRGYTESFLSLMQIIRNRGILPVIAVGNEGPGTSRSPGNYAVSLSVGASDKQNHVADYSSSHEFQRPDDPVVPDSVAPGSDTFSALPEGGFGEMDGTSMATPHIAGLAALLWEAKPAATVDEVEAAIFGSCTRPSTMPKERANRGVPDAVKAVELLLGHSLAKTTAAKPKSTKPKKKAAAKTKARKGAKAKRKVPRKAAKARR